MNETIEKVLAIIRSLDNAGNISGGELSEKALSLAIYKCYIGQKAVSLEFELSKLKLSRKIEWGRAYSDSTGTVDSRKIAADVSVEAMLKKEVELERAIGILKNLRADVTDCITTIQTRISQLRSEMSEQR